MNISFCSLHPYWHGLANNGGSQTILRNAQVLRDMGHRVDVVTKTDKFTWFKHPKVVHRIPKDTDVCIAIEASDIARMFEQAPAGAKLAYWMRALPTWQMPEEKIAKKVISFSKLGGAVFCNSQWLQSWLQVQGVASTIIYSGIDLENWYQEGEKIERTIGCVYNPTHETKKWGMFITLYNTFEGIWYDKYRWKFYSYGTAKKSPEKWIDQYESNPSISQKRALYSKTKIWFCPTELEGCHNVAMEAALCGCVIACNRKKRNGMGDFATDETALRYNNAEGAMHLCGNIKYYDTEKMVSKMQEIIKTKIGSRKQNMEKLIGALL